MTLPPNKVVDTRQAGENRIVTFTRTGSTFTGTLFGTFDNLVESLVFKPNRKVIADGFLECECTVEGKSGALVFRNSSTGSGSVFRGRWQIISGTGELENIQGFLNFKGTFNSDGSGTGTYSGRYYFDP